MSEEARRVSVKDYKPTPEQLAAIVEHDKKRAELVALTQKQWEEKQAAKRAKIKK